MKIIAKECPKCGANLKFKVGEKDIHCDSCRRDFAIEYDHDKAEDYVPDDFELKMRSHFEMSFKFTRIMFFVILLASIAFIIFAVIAQMDMMRGYSENMNQLNSSYQTNLR